MSSDRDDLERCAAKSRPRRRLRFALLAFIGVLYVVSVPWYRASDAPLQVVFGLPDWVAVALACYVGVAVLNSAAWLLTDVPDGWDPDATAEDMRSEASTRAGHGEHPQ